VFQSCVFSCLLSSWVEEFAGAGEQERHLFSSPEAAALAAATEQTQGGGAGGKCETGWCGEVLLFFLRLSI
jgi:hypothetical protein